MRFSRWLMLAFALAPAAPAEAARTIIVPRFSWHDWVEAASWCSGGPAAYHKVLEISFTNISNISQRLTLTCKASGFHSGSGTNPSQSLTMNSLMGGLTEQGPTATHSRSVTIAAGDTAQINCSGLYRGPASAGDWHISGSFDFVVTVDEDRGAVTGVINSTFEDNGCLVLSSSQVGLAIMSLRNTPRTILMNGGRPF